MPNKTSPPTDAPPAPADDWRDATGELRAVSARVGRLAARDAKRGTRAYLSRWRADAPGHAVTLAVGVVVAALVFAVAMTRASADTTGAERAAAATRLFSGVATQDAAGIGASTATPEARAGEAPADLLPAVREWWPQIITAATTHGIPPRLLACLTQQESGGQPGITSPAGAVGLAQIMPATGAELGLSPADLLDPAKNLDGGARYLAAQYKAFGSWRLALMAYNGGPGSAARFQMGGRIPAETTRYVQAILPCYERGA